MAGISLEHHQKTQSSGSDRKSLPLAVLLRGNCTPDSTCSLRTPELCLHLTPLLPCFHNLPPSTSVVLRTKLLGSPYSNSWPIFIFGLGSSWSLHVGISTRGAQILLQPQGDSFQHLPQSTFLPCSHLVLERQNPTCFAKILALSPPSPSVLPSRSVPVPSYSKQVYLCRDGYQSGTKALALIFIPHPKLTDDV